MLVFAANVLATEEITIIGTVQAETWDENDNITSVVITGESGYYFVVNNAVGHELFGLVDTDVEVTGILDEDSEGNQRITATRYKRMAE
jgi:hypothetical protein